MQRLKQPIAEVLIVGGTDPTRALAEAELTPERIKSAIKLSYRRHDDTGMWPCMTVSEREEVARRLALNARLPAIDVLLHALFDLAERPTPETAPQLFDDDQVMNPLSFDDDGKITAHRLRPPTEWFPALSKIELTATPQPELRQAIPGLKVVTPPATGRAARQASTPRR